MRRKAKCIYYAVCIDSVGKKRRVTIIPKGDDVLLLNDRGHRHLARERDIRAEIGTVYQYKVERFEYPWLEDQREAPEL
jgi:hypothetical protein